MHCHRGIPGEAHMRVGGQRWMFRGGGRIFPSRRREGRRQSTLINSLGSSECHRERSGGETSQHIMQSERARVCVASCYIQWEGMGGDTRNCIFNKTTEPVSKKKLSATKVGIFRTEYIGKIGEKNRRKQTQILAYPDGLDGTMDQIPRSLGEFDSFGGEGGSSWRDFISFRLDPAVV